MNRRQFLYQSTAAIGLLSPHVQAVSSQQKTSVESAVATTVLLQDLPDEQLPAQVNTWLNFRSTQVIHLSPYLEDAIHEQLLPVWARQHQCIGLVSPQFYFFIQQYARQYDQTLVELNTHKSPTWVVWASSSRHGDSAMPPHSTITSIGRT